MINHSRCILGILQEAETMENAEVSPIPKANEENLPKGEIPSSHALGLQDLYKAAFSQEPDTGFADFSGKTAVIDGDLIHEASEKFYAAEDEEEKIEGEFEKAEVVYKTDGFDESYQLYTLKGLQYSVDFAKPEETALELNYDPIKESQVLSAGTVLNRAFDPGFQNDANSVLDLDKGIQIHLVKAQDVGMGPAPENCNFETCEYTGDAQILHRYLCDTTLLKPDGSNVPAPVGTVTLNFVNKQNNNVVEKFDSESVGVNPEILGVRFEDCDFNSSDSFASTESIIPKNIMCPKCPKKFMFKSDLLRHVKYKHSVKLKLFCKYCNKEFVSQQNLFFHEKSHKKKRNSYKCETCKKVFKKSGVFLKHMMKKHSRTAPYWCAQCEKAFATQGHLNGHFRKVHMTKVEKPFKCEICSKSFEKKQGLSCHAKAHLKDHSHVCHQCNKAFSKACYLRNHQKSHMNEEKESFVCDACGKDFKSSAALEEHSRKHTGEKPFTCSVCMKRFAYKAYFKVHIKKHAEVKLYTCNHCQKTFATSSELSKHEKGHGKEKSFQCLNCSHEFSQQSQLAAHVKKQKCPGGNKVSQEVCTQTTDFVDGNPQNVTIQNVNVIMDQTFGLQQPIVLTSIGSFIDSNSVPVILTQNPSGPYTVAPNT